MNKKDVRAQRPVVQTKKDSRVLLWIAVARLVGMVLIELQSRKREKKAEA